jgi:hypothetical protein
MSLDDCDELLFTVEGARASGARGVKIESLGLTERAHLQEKGISKP